MPACCAAACAGTLGFDGVLVSDYNAIAELIQHGVAADLVEAATLALKAGVDIDMVSGAYLQGLPLALERGLVSQAEIDESVRRVLALKARLGLFEDPYRRGASAESATALADRRRLAREIAARSMVLLSNRGRGAAACRQPAAPGAHRTSGRCARGDARPLVVRGAAREPDRRARRDARGTAAEPRSSTRAASTSRAMTRAASRPPWQLCDSAEAVVLCLGEAATMSGEAASRAHPGLPGRQRQLAEAVLQRAAARAIPVIAVLFCGRPLIVPWLAEQASALLAAWFPGCEAGHALADVLTGRTSPSGRTPITWPRAVGQIPLYFGERSSGRPTDPTGPVLEPVHRRIQRAALPVRTRSDLRPLQHE